METIEGYKVAYEKKKKILYSRMDDSMIERLREIRRKTGISTSEVIREAVRRLLQEVDETGSIHLKNQLRFNPCREKFKSHRFLKELLL